MVFHNPFENPLFLPSLKIVGLLFLFGFAIVLFFARKDFKAGLQGELGKRFLGWMIIAPVFLIATFVRGHIAAAILFIFFYRVLAEYIQVVGVERPYAVYLWLLVPVTFYVAQYQPEFYFTLPAAAEKGSAARD